jgi:peptidoglycan/xylan/chitin deacetylase (PgdA/CDA1 family)
VELFERQLAELRAGGFKAGSLDEFEQPAGRRDARIILTFDDGFENVLRHGLEPLARSSFSAIQFLIADRLGALNDWEIAEGEKAERLMDASQVRDWLAAGHTIGSHTQTHPYLTRISRAEALEEIAASKKQLEDLFGQEVRHFCYPYGDFNAEIAALVAQAGYSTACTTRSGVNTSQTPPHQLLRFTARYPTRSIKSLKERLKRWKLFTF